MTKIRVRKNDLESTVLIRRCEDYDREAIKDIVSKGMRELDYQPCGKVFVKPNVVFAFKPGIYGRHAFTDPALVGASLAALSRSKGVTRVDLGENAAIGMSTRMAFKHAGYYKEIRKIKDDAACPVNIFCIDEERRDSVFTGGIVHDNLRVARKMARADTKVYLPKLKCHCVTNMTGAVKLNIGICSDDERAIRHDFLLNEKTVDLLAVGWPDFIVMDAIDVGVGNEAFPTPRRLGLILMSRNPVAIDLVGARLLGFGIDDVAYLKIAVNRGYKPSCLEEVTLNGDLTSISALDEHARRIMPYDADYFRWHDVEKELKRLNSPIRFFWGSYSRMKDAKCTTGCVMGIKMYLAFLERHAGAEAFARAKPVVLVTGRCDNEIDAQGNIAILIGSCAKATILNAKKVIHIDKCFTTAGDIIQIIRNQLGISSPIMDLSNLPTYVSAYLKAGVMKSIRMRYLQDIGHFVAKNLMRRV